MDYESMDWETYKAFMARPAVDVGAGWMLKPFDGTTYVLRNPNGYETTVKLFNGRWIVADMPQHDYESPVQAAERRVLHSQY